MQQLVSGISDFFAPHTWSMERVIKWIFVWIVLALALCVGFKSDTWWLLRAGQSIIHDHHIPLTNEYSWVFPEQYWPNHEWLTESLFYSLYWIGGLPGLVVGIAGIISVTWLLIYRLCEGNTRWRILIILLALIVNASSWAIRPAIISQLFSIGFIALIPHRRFHWLYPLLMIGWANFHAGVMQGLIVLGSCGLAAIFVDRKRIVHWLIIGIMATLGIMLNPLGWDLFIYASGSVNGEAHTFIEEWAAPSLGNPQHWPFFLLVLVTGVCAWRTRAHWRNHRDRSIVICTAVYAAMGLYSMRHTGIFAALAPVVISRILPVARSEPPVTRKQGRSNQGFALLLGVSMLSLPIFVWSQRAEPLNQRLIQALAGCPERTFNSYDDGGALIWLAQDRRVFVDSRGDPYPNAFITDVYYAEQGTYQQLFQTYAIECALVSKIDTPTLLEALRRDGWHLAYDDSTHAILRRP